MTTGQIFAAPISSAAVIPSMTGILTSMITRSGVSSVAISTACSPLLACPTTS
jgi:hypothetical protein